MIKKQKMKINEDNEVIRLSIEGQLKFAEMILNPRELTPELKRAQAAHERLIVSSK